MMASLPAIEIGIQPVHEGLTSDDTLPNTLLGLNDDIRRRILEFLLDAREVRVKEPNKKRPNTIYEFSDAILRTCKCMYSLGWKF